MRIAIVHDWLTGMRGGEKVLSLLCQLMPQADLFTLFRVPGSCDDTIERMRIRTSFLNDLPLVSRYYRYLLPLMPLAIEQMNVSSYDLIVSCSHCVAKGVIRSGRAAHICYCFTPMRYIWAQQNSYSARMGLSGLALKLTGGYLRAWDRRSASHVDRFLANSLNVSKRIRRTYGRSADVVYSPIDTSFLTPSQQEREDFYLMVTALAPYKRVDQAVEAFAKMGLPLRIIGDGQMLKDLRRSAPQNVEIMGWQGDDVVRDHYRRCKALIFPGEEDFGMVPLEAMACGAPVIAYGAGGALETVLDVDDDKNDKTCGPTGVLYRPQTVDGLIWGVRRFEQIHDRFQPQQLRQWAKRFSYEKFLAGFKRSTEQVLQQKGLPCPW